MEQVSAIVAKIEGLLPLECCMSSLIKNFVEKGVIMFWEFAATRAHGAGGGYRELTGFSSSIRQFENRQGAAQLGVVAEG